MNGTGRDSQNSGVWRYRQVGRRAVRLEVRGLAEPLRHGYGCAVCSPDRLATVCPKKGLNTATGAAGEGCNEKAAFITPGIPEG